MDDSCLHSLDLMPRMHRFGLELKYLTDSINALYNATQREDVADTLKYQVGSRVQLCGCPCLPYGLI
eukprot:39100-Eustigmatos_ZCMA.PRE.1